VVVAVGAAIVNDVPVPTAVPPQLVEYQFNVPPDPPIAVNVILPPSLEHRVVLSAFADVGFVGTGVTLMVTVAQLELPQPPPASHLAK
jgi:hypothetical protein